MKGVLWDKNFLDFYFYCKEKFYNYFFYFWVLFVDIIFLKSINYGGLKNCNLVYDVSKVY